QEGIEQIVRGWLAGYLEGKNIREKMQAYREWTEGGNGKRFFLLDNLNHTCYRVTEKYMCTMLEMVSFTSSSSSTKKGKDGKEEAEEYSSSSSEESDEDDG